ncbi:MAG: ATP-binding protein [Rhodospirillales bacterium]|nr:ATP-binding protein [Rhodospirillales bacterium]
MMHWRPDRRLGLRGRLNLLVAACVLPLLALVLANDILDFRRARAAQDAQALDEARNLADDIAHRLQAETVALQALSLSRHLRADPATIAPSAAQFLRWRAAPAALRLDTADGRVAFASGLPASDLSPPMLHEVFATAHPVIGNFGAAVLGGRPGFCINVPVIDGGAVRWNLRLVMSLRALMPAFTVERHAPGWGAAIVDGADRILLHVPANHAPFPGDAVRPALRARLRAGAEEGIVFGRRGDGTRLRVVWARVPGSDWAGRPWLAAIGIPQTDMLWPLYRNAGAALLAGLSTLLVGLVLAGAVARRISAPIARLQALAVTPDATRTGMPPTTGLRETDAVAAALYAAAAARRDALARLQALADTLETRVAEEVAARQAAQDRAAQGERLQALGRLASGIAHDVNNVLQSVHTASEVLARAADPATVQRMARVLGHAAQQGGAITGRLLGFARPDALPRLAPLALPPLLADLRDMLAATLGGRVTVRLDLPDALPPVLADRGQLGTVLINLAANARDAMPRGGELVLSATCAATPPSGLPPGDYVALSVADQGSGMSPAVLARVTEPFFTTKPAGRGTGLGLSLARGFAEQAGGALAIDSIEGRGTTVTLFLRAVAAAAW